MAKQLGVREVPESNFELAENLAKISDVERAMLVSQMLGKALNTSMVAKIRRVDYRPTFRPPFQDPVSIVLDLFGNTDEDDLEGLVGAMQQLPDSDKASVIANAFSRVTELPVKCVITHVRYPERMGYKRGIGLTLLLGTIERT
jgi:hypothetical protein